MTSLSPETLTACERHPCFSSKAHHKYARLHLPVAPACNVQCNYCNRKFACVQESRPGVTSEVLSPDEALEKFLWVKKSIAELSVVGIAGPGEALANWEATRESLEKMRRADADVLFCLSTNGLLLPTFAPELLNLGIHHVTVTVNAVDPKIGAGLYQHVNFGGENLKGIEGASVLLENQMKGIAYLTEHGVLVKINIVMVKGVNDAHIPQVVGRVKELGAFITNIMPLIPAPGSNFAHYPQTSMKEVNALRDQCGLLMPQMRHCQQCRADAVGLLGDDRSREFCLHKRGRMPVSDSDRSYRIAVATRSGRVVDLHFGHAETFTVYEGDGHLFTLTGRRTAERYCGGKETCFIDETDREKIFVDLHDCDAVLALRIGYEARERLKEYNVVSIESCDTVDEGLRHAVSELNRQA
ncbi:hypothetical protein FACS1894206_01860 [Deltaproteobacteria bacterium]|nr:hypothetical protein FACS1894206_01860 [Deltaproteobacteria bacterium]